MIQNVDHNTTQLEPHCLAWEHEHVENSKEYESFRMPHFDSPGELGDVGIEATAKPKASKHKIICFQCRKLLNGTCPVSGKGNAISCSYYDKF